MISNYLCTQCATFNVSSQKGLECEFCGYRPNKYYIKVVHKYAKHVYKYGHMYRARYQKQLDYQGHISTKFCTEPQSVYTFIGIAMLSGIIGNFAWDAVKSASDKIIESYNRKHGSSESISEEELQEIFESYNIFINHFDEINEEVRMAILEEILTHESGKSGKKAMRNAVIAEYSSSPAKKRVLVKQNEKLAKNISKEIRRKLSHLEDAKNENFDDYWGKIKIEK